LLQTKKIIFEKVEIVLNFLSIMDALTKQIRVMSVDDHPLLREGLTAIVNSQTDMTLVAEASSGKEGIEQFRRHLPDVTLMDLRMPDMSGVDTLISIRGEFPKARIIILTTFEGDVEIGRALAAGAKGYLLKSMVRKELLDVIPSGSRRKNANSLVGCRANRRTFRRGASHGARNGSFEARRPRESQQTNCA
jgi:DNA-binding NarL/FixJ family response regulator